MFPSDRWGVLLLFVGACTVLRGYAAMHLWGSALSLAPSMAFGAMVVTGVEGGMVAAVVGTVAGDAMVHGRRLYRAAFEGAVLAVAVYAGGAVLGAMGGPESGELAALALAVATVFVVDTAILAGESILAGMEPGELWTTTLRGRGSAYAAGAPLVCAAIYLWPYVGASALAVLAVPAVVAALAVRKTYEILYIQRQLAAMERVNRHAVGDRDMQTLLGQFVRAVRSVAPLQSYAVWLIEEDEERLRLASSSEALEKVLPETAEIGSGWAGWAAERRRTLFIRDARSDPRTPAGMRGKGSVAAIPLLVQKKLVGVFEIRHPAPKAFNAVHVDAVEALCRQVAVAIENHRLHQKLRELAVTDGLTGLLNHRRMYETLRDEIWRAQRYGHPVSVVMIDVDGFKSYNDTYGHPKGDLLLRSIADIVRSSIRGVDIAARYGGEEFLVIMPETGKDKALGAAERIRKAVEGALFEGRTEGHHVRKTVSIGVASYPENTRNYAEMITLADRALYKAKQRGKNRVLAV
jgi:diguanylate cyclase (GGDEF)-like protein